MSRIKYRNPKAFTYYSPRYKQCRTVPADYESDGASMVTDIYSRSWWVHDILHELRRWDSGSPCTYQQANNVLYDILVSEGRYGRAPIWWLGTTIFGPIYRKFNKNA